MFFATYLLAELRHRSGRTVVTALGLAIGVGLVVTVSALSTGLDRAQAEVLEPLTGVGTDMSVTRPIDIGDPGQGGFPNLSDDERQRLREEDEGGRLGLTDLGEPGTRFSRDTRQVTTGRYFDDPDARQAILNESYASRQAMGIGDTLTLRDTRRRSATGASRGCGATAAVGGEAPCSSAPHS